MQISQFRVYCYMGKLTKHFDTEDQALEYFTSYIGDAVLLDKETVIDTKKYVESFDHLIHSALCHVLGETVPWPDRDTLSYYKKLLPLFKDPKKGVAITGPPGVGKTTMMKVFSTCIVSDYIKDAKPFRIVPLQKIAKSFIVRGFDALDEFRIGEKWKSNVCVDDVGIEYLNVKVYGTNVNIFPELIQELYETFTQYKTVTHFTTNLLPEEINAQYGDRLFDRIVEMAELISVDGDSKRI